MEDDVILVNRNDDDLGSAGKMAVHRRGALHRAVSIFLFDARGRLLLQKRAAAKYHSAGLWSNTCCSHPRPSEQSAHAARRRLREEMGIDCELKEVFSFIYRAVLGNGLIEHEYDHVFLGNYDGFPLLNPEEADDWRWMEMRQLSTDVRNRPRAYSYWLAASLHQVINCLATSESSPSHWPISAHNLSQCHGGVHAVNPEKDVDWQARQSHRARTKTVSM
jgi:isopentenyl-diphosphate Delta-isomerase